MLLTTETVISEAPKKENSTPDLWWMWGMGGMWWMWGMPMM
jgi:hypothetical protein